jgi:hypothetical protein
MKWSLIMRLLHYSRSLLFSVVLGVAAVTPASAQNFERAPGLPPEPVYGYNSGFQAVARASQAIEERRYTDAWLYLRDVAPASSSAHTKFLAGLANAGTGDLLAARRYFAQAAALLPSWPAAQTALAITDMHLGNRRAIETRLTRLERRQRLCDRRCDSAAEIDTSTLGVRRVLARY